MNDKCTTQIVIDYAGKDGWIMREQAAKYGLENIVVDHGYLSRNETMKLQSAADLFLVVSWNTKSDQGILTGKFYEALQQKKPIVALVSGDVPRSELKMLIDKYRLGVCYEEADKPESERMLEEYLLAQYQRKQRNEPLLYSPDEAVFGKFEYSGIVKELESIMVEITGACRKGQHP